MEPISHQMHKLYLMEEERSPTGGTQKSKGNTSD
jgi:hypothetical protein